MCALVAREAFVATVNILNPLQMGRFLELFLANLSYDAMQKILLKNSVIRLFSEVFSCAKSSYSAYC